MQVVIPPAIPFSRAKPGEFSSAMTLMLTKHTSSFKTAWEVLNVLSNFVVVVVNRARGSFLLRKQLKSEKQTCWMAHGTNGD